MLSKNTFIKLRKPALLLLLLVIPTIIFYFFVFTGVHHVSRLPFYGPEKIQQGMRRGSLVSDTLPYELPPFRLRTADGNILDGKTLDGKIYVANFIDFSQLKEIPPPVIMMYSELKDKSPGIIFLTHFENYEGQILKRPSEYTSRWEGADSAWIYVVDTEPDSIATQTTSLRELRNAYFVPDSARKIFPDPYSIVLVDKEKRIRGYYNPTLAEDLRRICDEVDFLKKEYGYNYKTHRYYEYEQKLERRNQ